MIGHTPSRKKPSYLINNEFRHYLQEHGRAIKLPVVYQDLLRYANSFPLMDQKGEDTLWETVFYQEWEREEIHAGLTKIYSILRAGGDEQVLEHLSVERIDYCTFGNSKPFRVRIINRYNDNFDHFYVKRADASRVYGLELEDMLSPNRITYFVDGDTLIEEHISGVPGDDFMKKYLDDSEFNQIRIAKEFVKFNERCFVRLLGDMRSYNYVVDITPDIEGSQYRMRAIDFDQQSYEGRKSFYLPQYFKSNNPVIFLGMKHMNPDTVRQYQLEERSMIARRVRTNHFQINQLFRCMMKDKISTEGKALKLKEELGEHHKTDRFNSCRNMGQVVMTNIELLLADDFKQSIIL